MTDFSALQKNILSKAPISDADFDFLCSKMKVNFYKKKSPILRQGEVCKYLSYINKGAGRGYLINDKNEERTIILGIEDWWLNDLQSYTTGIPSRITLEAIEDCELFQITYKDLVAVMDVSPAMERFVRLAAMNSFAAAQTRLIDMMTNTVDERYKVFIKKFPHFFNRFPQYVIASYLNVSPEHLSAVRAKMSKK
jgi:CRP-like cAMP-binding protein